ncbi:MAG: hypothetical protein KGL46_06115 [Hyphomicrobiales bacterium]|nr:hypothetical protein [Hyphomicrobiales bacterium]
MRAAPFLMLSIAALTLSACNANRPAPVAAAPQASQGAAAPLPAGAACSEQIARYRAVADQDHQTGNVNESVFKQIDSEIGAASAACRAGNDAQAIALVRASKSRHGYPQGA